MLSIIIPTKNEARHISQCIEAVKWAVADGLAEVIVVDNSSEDETQRLAKEAGARVVVCGPERSAQRNRGGITEAAGDYLLFVDADMRVKKETLREILDIIGSGTPPDALYVREEIAGEGYWNKVRNFERSFYDMTCIDGLRVIRSNLFSEVGGYDERLYACEDWDLDRRIKKTGAKLAITRNALVHEEGAFSLAGNLKKKSYYSKAIHRYVDKWDGDATVRKQLGVWYRFVTVFLENGKWRKALARPDLMACILFYRFLIAVVFLFAAKED